MEKKYYAHSLEGKPPEEWQPLEEHLRNVAKLARSFADSFGAGDMAFVAGLLHDLGKYQEMFQQKLLIENDLEAHIENAPGKVDHSTVGALYAESEFGKGNNPFDLALAYLIAGHHAGLPDWIREIGGGGALSNRLEKKALEKQFLEVIPERYKNLAQLRIAPPGNKPLKHEHLHLWIRMLFSCLVDADFLDTEAFMEPDKAIERGGYGDLREIKSRFDDWMMKKVMEAPESQINRQRKAVLEMCRKNAELEPGIFSLTVPTGGGKTLASMGFALDHAVRYGKKKVIVAIPYTSIIEQTAKVYKYGTDDEQEIAKIKENSQWLFGEKTVLEHHSNLDPDKETRKSRLAAENWDAPIIVTTNVQLFESIFSSRTSTCRKLHNLANSIIILDEAQMLPPEYLKSILSTLRGLVLHFGVTVLLCTATQPAFRGKIGSPPSQFEGLSDVREVVDDPIALFSAFHRVDLVTPTFEAPKSTWEEVARALSQYEQVLCIVNSRRDCRELHALMPPDTVHLSGLMCPEERSDLVSEIKTTLKCGGPVRVVSTQLVEAGVDIDFPVVYRAVAGFDSLAQAAGRCNREGKLNALGHRGQVIVFEPPRAAPAGLLRKGQDAGREILRTNQVRKLTPDLFENYFRLFYSRVNSFDRPNYDDRLVRDARQFHFQFRTFAQEFHLIDDLEQTGIIVWFRNKNSDSQDLIEQLRLRGPDRWLMRKLQRFVVNVPKRCRDQLERDGLIEVLHGYSVQACPGFYRPGLGLLCDDVRWDPEDLIQ
jgi:CRISPR-associated endonuclease/helicase Cas3